jgi:hypothetical protein
MAGPDDLAGMVAPSGTADDISGMVAAPAAAPAAAAGTGPTAAPAAAPAAAADNLGDLTHHADSLAGMTAPPAASSFTPLQTLKRTFAKNSIDLLDDLNEMVKSPSVLGKAWGAAKSLGAAISVPFSPIEAGITEAAGKPLQALTGISAETTGEVGSDIAMFFLDPITAFTSIARAGRATKIATDIIGTLAPEGLTKEAGIFAGFSRKFSSMEHTANVRVEEKLKPYQGMINRLPEDQRIEYIYRIQHGLPQATPGLQAAADTFRRLQDETTLKLQRMGQVVGKNILQDANEFYHGQIWQELTPAGKAAAAGTGKRPLQGSGAFLKRRSYRDVKEGLAAGEKLLTTDPVELELIKFREQHKFLYGTWQAHAMKKSGIAKFIRVGDTVPTGFKKLDDRVFKAILPPAKVVAEHDTAYDEGLREGLQNLADFLKVKVKTPLRSQDPYLGRKGSGTLGYTTNRPRAPVVSRFGNEAVVLEHEIGHQIDNIYGLARIFQRAPGVWPELAHLAARRVKDFWKASPSFRSYLLNPPERMANMWHAYFHAPEMLKSAAPATWRTLERFLNANPDLKAAVEAVKPTLRIAGETQTEVFNVAGLRIMGEWYAPEEAARVFNNYVSPSALAGHGLVDSIRAVGMGLNMLQLGLSAFHATFTTVDVMVSQLARAIKSAAAGHFGEAAMQAISTPTAAFLTVGKGAKLRRAILDPKNLSNEERAMVQAFNLAGGRVRMDAFYRATEHSLFRGLRDGTLVRSIAQNYEKSPVATVLKAPFQIAGAAISDISHPVMDYLVPRQKLGVFANLASDWLRRNPLATEAERAIEMQKIWNSVDNRLGQMVYDNIFWKKTLKDVAFLATRSVGWNLGTMRELGGGLIDTTKAISALRAGDQVEFTHRMAYAISMPIVTGIIGASLTYLYTGHGPTQMMDYFFPPTGRNTPRGGKERVIVPSYIKDVLEYNNEPVRTVVSKMNPLWETVAEFYNNRDFYGGIIHNPGGDFATQAEELASYLANQMMPFSVRSQRRLAREGSDVGEQIGSFFGLQAAPAWITDPARAKVWEQRQNAQALRRRLREEATR